MAEDESVEQLLAEIGELHHVQEPVKVEPTVEERSGRVVWEVFGKTFERDDDTGLISRIVGPGVSHTVIRDDKHRLVGLETETETVEFEDE